MVSVYFGWDNSVYLDVDGSFNHLYEPEWLDDPFVREMIQDVDKSVVLSNQCIQSPVLGQIPPERLSGGVKTCIMLYKLDDFYTDLIVCGENCQKWLSKVFMKKDVVRVAMSGYDLDFRGFEIKGICENDNTPINSWEDWADKMFAYAGEPENER